MKKNPIFLDVMMQNVCLRLGSRLEYLHSFFVLLGLDVNNLGQVLESFLKMEKQQIDILKSKVLCFTITHCRIFTENRSPNGTSQFWTFSVKF